MSLQSRNTALGGIMAALCMICLYGAVYMPTGRISLYALSSIFCGIMVVESGVRWGWVFYGSTAILSLVLIPNKMGIVPYILFFGPYGLIKYHIESFRSRLIGFMLKACFFLLSMAATAYTVKGLFLGEVYSKLPVWALILVGLVIFYIYDYVYTTLIHYYMKKIKHHMRH